MNKIKVKCEQCSHENTVEVASAMSEQIEKEHIAKLKKKHKDELLALQAKAEKEALRKVTLEKCG